MTPHVNTMTSPELVAADVAIVAACPPEVDPAGKVGHWHRR
jgi:hypothetical protein